jgi:signal transduction histidine kinase
MTTAASDLLADPARLDALRATGLLDAPASPAFDRLSRLAAHALDAPTAFVSLVGAEEQVVAGSAGLDGDAPRVTPNRQSYCQHVVARSAPLVIQDARLDPLVKDSPWAARLPAYLGVPLRAPGGAVLGSFCVVDRHPRKWTEAQLALLEEFAESAATEIRLRAELAERERIERRLTDALAAAERANAAKTQFLGRMSHELRTPLNAVIGFSRLLAANRGARLAPTDVTLAQRIQVNGTHLLALIDDILDLSRIEAGRLDLELVPTDVATLVREVVDQLSHRAEDRRVELRVRVPDRLEPLVTDAMRFRQVLINLVGNALKFTEEGHVMVCVDADASGCPIRLLVEDTGIGIPDDRVEAIFAPFEQAGPETGRRFGGTGLGLAISRELCSRMGYLLRVRSRPGDGSTFVVELAPAS